MTTTTPLGRVLRYIWGSEPPPLGEDELIVLGKAYEPSAEVWPQDFVEDVASRVWLMYRTNFAAIPRHPEGPSPIQITSLLRGGSIDSNGFVSDVGWGCMIRTGQSLVANALLTLRLGREWRFDGTLKEPEIEILRLFYDEPNAPFSIHQFVDFGAKFGGKLPGQWFGPNTVASGIRALSEAANVGLQVYVSSSMDIYEDELLTLARGVSSDEPAASAGPWQPVLLLCGLRLGLQQINPIYYDGLRAMLASPQSVGIAGGRTSASHYFYGMQGDRLFYHDPHVAKPALQGDPNADALVSVHSTQLRALDRQEMDPSLLAGFLLKTEADFESWKEQMAAVPERSRVVSLLKTRPDVGMASDDDLESDGEMELQEETANESTMGASIVLPDGGPGERYVVCGDSNEQSTSPTAGSSLQVEPSSVVAAPVLPSDEVVVSAPSVADEAPVVIDLPTARGGDRPINPVETVLED